ncbi:MAG: type II toxin-antitoxin system PemK/MazF family toxin [Armatimonadetes bacterium]|nr:type II toxin-antitoxin system PemK/MazF family toxin [Armatimonadota bacterium]
MTRFERGDVFLIAFPFSDRSGGKQRPVLVISSEAYHENRQEVIVAAITSQVGRAYYGDYALSHWRQAGLLLPSLVTGIIRTVKSSAFTRKLGHVEVADFRGVEISLRSVLCL